MGYGDFSKDFIKKTKQILVDYRELWEKEIHDNNAYEITLALNCMHGLAVYVKDKYYDKLNENELLFEKIGLIDGVEFTGEPKFKNGVLAIRNTIAHMGDISNKEKNVGIELNGTNISDDNIGNIKEVESLTFKCKRNGCFFEIDIDIKNHETALEDFLVKFCDVVT